MAEKKSFLLHFDQYAPIEGLSLEQKGKLLDAFFLFNMGEEVFFDDPVIEMAFSFFRESFKRDKEGYDRKCQKNRDNILRRHSKDTNVYDGNEKIRPDTMATDRIGEDRIGLRTDPDGSVVAEAPASPDSPPDCPHRKITALYHEMLPELPKVIVWGDERQEWLRARWRETWERLRRAGQPHDEEALIAWWKTYFARVRASPFLMGKKEGKNGYFTTTLEWLVRPRNYANVVENKFRDRKPEP